MLSIIVPTIRTHKWQQLYHSICNSILNIPFELILIGPRYDDCLSKYKNVKFIQDFGSPNRCQQIGLLNASHEYFLAAADDCIFCNNILSSILRELEYTCDSNYITKYSEGNGNQTADSYYLLHKAYPDCTHIQKEWFIFNTAILRTSCLINIGGFDCQFQTTAFGHADLAARWQNLFGISELNDIKLLHCEHGQNDHQPIEISHVFEDTPNYIAKYSSDFDNIVSIHNWKKSEAIWSKR